ncbi:TPA: DUF3389 family protein [Vibrio alginolyticus]|uniref:DUF3389 family protein n=1 Tax=Vibrio alginolyticus TaxID=663 RepID=UPI001BD236D2|nr:DUF3389 family protein [Vibrio alginolyticus]ELA8360375.1 DUF3389 family protein [Vibrio alginolyticus]MBS9958703.1 DUF3389 family protein [Vibrio alginolyticus]MBT0004984.1 DUF3389 family protein [Vibrio alginolyticus]MBT0034334.1 DUF3389 family protein [Vibrio alginolyticus]HCZ9043249.1 DUF3389 family protein [Vibrio alginolyticus]
MVIEFSLGKIIATQREIVIKISGSAMVTLQAQTDAIGAECKWSIKLDNEEQLAELSREIGTDIQ